MHKIVNADTGQINATNELMTKFRPEKKRKLTLKSEYILPT